MVLAFAMFLAALFERTRDRMTQTGIKTEVTRISTQPGFAYTEEPEEMEEDIHDPMRAYDLDDLPGADRPDTTFTRNSTLTSIASTVAPEPRSGWFGKVKDFIMQTGPYADEENAEFIPNYRYLPILSGIVIPMAIMLEIPGLTEHWYVRQEGNVSVEYQDNPIILDVGLAISMTSGVLANICLIVRFLEKRVKLMTTVAICALICHDLINSVAVSIFGIEHRFDDGFTYSQAFWLTLCSTGSSLFTTITLIWDLRQTPNFSQSGSGLTRKQRSLVIIWMILLTYMSLGALCWSFLLNLQFADALYFTVVSIESVGFGDFHPAGPGPQMFSLFYNTFGILNVALFIATTRQTLIEGFQQSYRRRRHELSLRRLEYRKQRAEQRARRLAVERQLREAGLPLYVRRGSGRGMKLNSAALVEMQRKAMDDEVVGVSIEDSTTNETKKKTVALARDLENDLRLSGLVEGLSYKQFRAQIAREEKKEFAAKMLISVSLFAMFWVFGILVFMKTESWSFVDSVYFCYVTFSTIGYGDVVPESSTGRAIFVLWGLLGIGTMTILFTVLSDAYESSYSSAVHNKVFEKAVKNFNARQAPEPETTQLPAIQTPGDRHTIRKELERIPAELLDHAKTFQEHMQYFNSFDVQGKGNHLHGFELPVALKTLLDDIADTEKMDKRLKKEIIQDVQARKTLFMMSYEQSLRKMIETAEKAMVLLADRNKTEGPDIPDTPANEVNDFRNDGSLLKQAVRRVREEKDFNSRRNMPPGGAPSELFSENPSGSGTPISGPAGLGMQGEASSSRIQVQFVEANYRAGRRGTSKLSKDQDQEVDNRV